jgi:hypothetical protein
MALDEDGIELVHVADFESVTLEVDHGKRVASSK